MKMKMMMIIMIMIVMIMIRHHCVEVSAAAVEMNPRAEVNILQIIGITVDK